ncbi:FolC protein [Aphelenchoides avenae]|nr:FolC protein [Aphelenchus avenae]
MTHNVMFFQKAVFLLNSLQSNATALSKIRERRHSSQYANLRDTENLLHQLGITFSHIDKLNVIHIAGTKGKGSTSAFVESILRKLGFSTGFYRLTMGKEGTRDSNPRFYSSPHLVHVRERIRINGNAISEAQFSNYFFEVYEQLDRLAASDKISMPAYFKFLTLMAFHVFLAEKVDVAIVEVGIGGEFDCTNVVRNPVVCGITTLDFDHTSILGSTLAEIAWNKAGIMKPGSTALTVDQPAEAMECALHVVPDIDEYKWPNGMPEVGIAGRHQLSNVSLALSLHTNGFADPQWEEERLRGCTVPAIVTDAIRSCSWPGRSQILAKGSITYFLDGAHTPKSLQCCAEWFEDEAKQRDDGTGIIKVLLFHCTADRDPEVLLPYIKDCGFSVALFCPTRLHTTLDKSNDNTNLNQSDAEQITKCRRNKEIWERITGNTESKTFDCIEDALTFLKNLSANNTQRIHVLVSGSLHLVGGVLYFVDPDAAS